LKDNPRQTNMGRMKRAVPAFVSVIFCVTAAAWVLWPGLNAWFVADDFWHLAFSRFISTPWRSWVHPQFGEMAFRPLTFTFNHLQINLLGTAPFRIHFIDLLLHCLNTAMVFVLFFRIFSSRLEPEENPERTLRPVAAGFSAALVFAVHPVSALTATWFACRADLLATFFSLAALSIVAGKGRGKTVPILLSGLFAFLALSAKVTHLPLLVAAFLVALSAMPEGRITEKLRVSAWKGLPILIATVLYLFLRLYVLRGIGGYEPPPDSLSLLFAQAFYNYPRVVWYSLKDVVVHDLISESSIYTAMLLCLAVLLLCGLIGSLIRAKAPLLLGIAFFMIMLTPAWNLAHMFALREERLIYFPLVGLIMIGSGSS